MQSSGARNFPSNSPVLSFPVISFMMLVCFCAFKSSNCLTVQETLQSYHGVHNATLVKIEEASTAAYNKAIYLILLIGFLMLCGNIWFWLCFVIRRQGHSCCGPVGHTVGKDSSCETELVTSHSSNSSLQNMKTYYQAEYPGPEPKPNSDGLLRKRSLAQDSHHSALSEGHSISFISNGSVPGRTSTVELVPCLKNSRRSRGAESGVQGIATLPRHGRGGQCEGEGSGETPRQTRGSGQGLDRSAPLSRSSSQGDGREGVCTASSSRPYMSTFCHVLPPPLPEPMCHEFTGEKSGKQLQASVTREQYDLQTKFLQPESV